MKEEKEKKEEEEEEEWLLPCLLLLLPFLVPESMISSCVRQGAPKYYGN